MKKILILIFLGIIALFLIMQTIRILSPKEMDDISPEIFCEKNYIQKSKILWIIPKFNNKPISQNKTFCSYILSLNKTLGMHGVHHTYQEFKGNITQEYLQEGILEFQKCFNQTPILFKPPQLKISFENIKLISHNNMILKESLNQLTHKVYHCNDTGMFSNRFIDFF